MPSSSVVSVIRMIPVIVVVVVAAAAAAAGVVDLDLPDGKRNERGREVGENPRQHNRAVGGHCPGGGRRRRRRCIVPRRPPVVDVVVVVVDGIPAVDIEAVTATMAVITHVLAAMATRRERIDQRARHERADLHDHVEQPERRIPGSPTWCTAARRRREDG